VWKNGTNEYCWRDANWTPATAAVGCDGALVVQAPAPAPVAAPPVVAPPPPPPAPAPQPPAATKVTYAADAFFDFDKAVLKPEGKAKLDDLVEKVKGINLEVIIAVGHTDSVGTDTYNQKLSVRRAEAVKAYLVSKGIEKNRVYTEGKGEKQPVADNKTAEGRAKNRRVEIEVVGTRSSK
jgi:OOP family OmpA-OmpF porin